MMPTLSIEPCAWRSAAARGRPYDGRFERRAWRRRARPVLAAVLVVAAVDAWLGWRLVRTWAPATVGVSR